MKKKNVYVGLTLTLLGIVGLLALIYWNWSHSQAAGAQNVPTLSCTGPGCNVQPCLNYSLTDQRGCIQQYLSIGTTAQITLTFATPYVSQPTCVVSVSDGNPSTPGNFLLGVSPIGFSLAQAEYTNAQLFLQYSYICVQ
jgi:hypothetical protein